jgi:hypothetical protein
LGGAGRVEEDRSIAPLNHIDRRKTSSEQTD